jgi:hypothetical protein
MTIRIRVRPLRRPTSFWLIASSVVLLAPPAYGQVSKPPAAKQEAKGVELKITAVSTATYNVQEQGEDGQFRWGPPSKRVDFSEDLGKQHAIYATVGQKTITCPLRYQDVAYSIDTGKRTGRVAVSWYGGCPFEITDSLSASSDFEMREETILEIESAQGNVLFVSPSSARPIVFQGGQVHTGCETFRNMVWVFKKQGTVLSAKDATYVVTRAGGRITFSAGGLKMDGIERKK